MAKIPPYKCGIDTYGAAAIAGGSSPPIVYSDRHKIQHAIPQWLLFNNIGSDTNPNYLK
jgi:hypothetical protein